MQIEEGKFYKSHDGQALRCLRVSETITSFSHFEAGVIEGPTDSIGTFISEAKLEELTDTEYMRRVIAWHTAGGDTEKYMTEYGAIEHLAKPIVHAKFMEHGGYKEFELKTEEMSKKELEEATRQTADDAAPIAIVFKAETLIEPLTTIRSLITGLQSFQETHWCVEVRNALIDLENAHGWLSERNARKKAQALDAVPLHTSGLAQATDQEIENIAGDEQLYKEAMPDNVLPLNQ